MFAEAHAVAPELLENEPMIGKKRQKKAENEPTPRPLAGSKRRLTYDDYARMTPPKSGNFELHDGKLIQMASPIPPHQDLALILAAEMRLFAKKHGLGKVFIAPLDTVFDVFNTLQPDILFIPSAKMHLIGPKKIEGAPDLVVEILSESNSSREMSYKKYVYESFGVAEYWVIDLRKNTVAQHLNDEGEFSKTIFKAAEKVESVVLNGFHFSLAELLEG